MYEASLDADWLQWAETLQETQDKLFWDEKDGGYFSSSAVDKTILLRGKEGNTFDICTYRVRFTLEFQIKTEPNRAATQFRLTI